VTNEPDLTRDQQWVSTMAGFEQSSITLAHADSWAGIGTKDIVDRSAREALLDAAMAPLATLSGGPGIRAIAEEPDPLRTCFERDRDRI
jgi:dGTPase